MGVSGFIYIEQFRMQPPLHPIFFISMQFSGKKYRIISLSPLGAGVDQGNPGSATGDNIHEESLFEIFQVNIKDNNLESGISTIKQWIWGRFGVVSGVANAFQLVHKKFQIFYPEHIFCPKFKKIR